MDESAFSRKKDSSKQRGNAAKERLFSELSGTADQVVLPEIGGAASSKREKGAALNKRISVVELEEEIFHMPVRLGSPQQVKGLTDIVTNPIYSTGVGLLQYGLAQQMDGGRKKRRKINDEASLMERVKSWFQGNF